MYSSDNARWTRYSNDEDDGSFITPVHKTLDDGFLEDDSGYKGTESTPRIYKRSPLKGKRLRFNANVSPDKERQEMLDEIQDLVIRFLPYIITIIFVSSIFFTVFMGNRSTATNGK